MHLCILARIWSCNHSKRKFSMNGYSSRFSHIHILSSCPSKQCPIKVEQKICQNKLTVVMEKEIPSQPLLLAPNGINWKSCPLKSVEEVKNFSDWNFSRLSHNPGSLPIAHILIKTRVLVAMHSLVLWHLELILSELTVEEEDGSEESLWSLHLSNAFCPNHPLLCPFCCQWFL